MYFSPPFQTTFEELLVRGYLYGFGIAFKVEQLLLSFHLLFWFYIFKPEIDKLGYGFLVAYVLMGMTWEFYLNG